MCFSCLCACFVPVYLCVWECKNYEITGRRSTFFLFLCTWAVSVFTKFKFLFLLHLWCLCMHMCVYVSICSWACSVRMCVSIYVCSCVRAYLCVTLADSQVVRKTTKRLWVLLIIVQVVVCVCVCKLLSITFCNRGKSCYFGVCTKVSALCMYVCYCILCI